jgi:hypothetical protein
LKDVNMAAAIFGWSILILSVSYLT